MNATIQNETVDYSLDLITAVRGLPACACAYPFISARWTEIEPQQGSDDSEEEVNKPINKPEETQNPAPEVGQGE